MASLVSACNDDVASQDDAGGAAAEGPVSCEPEDLIRHAGPEQNWLYCGYVAVAADAADVAMVRACAEEAIAVEQAFQLVWDVQGIDSEVSVGIYGIHEASGYHTYRIDYDSGGFGLGGYARISSCAANTLQFKDTCEDASLCVSCTSQPNLACECRGEPAKVTCG